MSSPSRPRSTPLDWVAGLLVGAMLLGTCAAIARILAGSWRGVFAPLAAVAVSIGVGVTVALLVLRRRPRSYGIWPWAGAPTVLGLGGVVWDVIAPTAGDPHEPARVLVGIGVVQAVFAAIGRWRRARADRWAA